MSANRYGMRRRHIRQNHMGMFLVTVVVLMLMVVVSINGASLKSKVQESTERQAKLQEMIEAENERADELVDFEKYTKTKAYYEQVAREKLGLVYPGEIIFKTE